MKKAVTGILAVFLLLGVLAAGTVRFANDRLYAALYPAKEQLFLEDDPRTAVLKPGDWFTSGSYNGERLVWHCVANDRVQCEKVIEFLPYDAESSDWETSDLRRWLNAEDGFRGRASVHESLIRGEINVLSEKELKKLGSVARQPTLPAIRNSRSEYLFLRKNVWYWTSSPVATNSQSVAAVTQNGGFYKTLPTDELTGVCPAFTLKSRTVHILGGDGSEQKPYVIG